LLNASQTSRSTAEAERGEPAQWAEWPESSPAESRRKADEPEPLPEEELDETILGMSANGPAALEDEPAPYVPTAEAEALIAEPEPAPERAFEPEPVPERAPARAPAPARAVEPASTSTAATSFEDHMEIRFARLNENATIPARAHEGDAGMDLCAAEAARIGPGQRVGVGTGLAVEIPEGWAGMVLPRSGLALKHGIALVNSPGLIDPGYRGEIRVLLLNTDATSEFKVAAGDRIAQLVLTPFSTAKPVEAGGLEASARGSGGFGSTGA
jgi:dUTP pyrophosphatase